jgi:3-hydroxyisobutyrate dehydrogenase
MNTNAKPTIAFLGMGLMGSRMACNLIRAGWNVQAYNRTPSRAEPVVALGGTAWDSPHLAAKNAQCVISCVTDGPDVLSVLFGEQGAVSGASPNTLFIDMSTISPDVSKSIGQQLQERGMRFLEAPVTGGTIGAQNATLSILAGGSKEDFEQATPILQAMGKNITYCGPWGAGQGVKLCNQIMGALNLLGVCEAMALAKGLAIDPAILVQALQGGAATSWALQNLGPKICNADWSPGFMVDTQQKDMRLVAQAAESAQVSLPGAALVTQLWRSAQVYGNGSEGIHALAKVLDRLSNQSAS